MSPSPSEACWRRPNADVLSDGEIRLLPTWRRNRSGAKWFISSKGKRGEQRIVTMVHEMIRINRPHFNTRKNERLADLRQNATSTEEEVVRKHPTERNEKPRLQWETQKKN